MIQWLRKVIYGDPLGIRDHYCEKTDDGSLVNIPLFDEFIYSFHYVCYHCDAKWRIIVDPDREDVMWVRITRSSRRWRRDMRQEVKDLLEEAGY